MALAWASGVSRAEKLLVSILGLMFGGQTTHLRAGQADRPHTHPKQLTRMQRPSMSLIHVHASPTPSRPLPALLHPGHVWRRQPNCEASSFWVINPEPHS
ncbi:hypothetical protein EV126DRAFT_223649 [Verticillium dahliae]|nr:hypothetical protein EV126DRAFT_223649 [Verticillium dahliae]